MQSYGIFFIELRFQIMMKLVLISDTHARHRELTKIPSGQIIIHAGDFSRYGEV